MPTFKKGAEFGERFQARSHALTEPGGKRGRISRRGEIDHATHAVGSATHARLASPQAAGTRGALRPCVGDSCMYARSLHMRAEHVLIMPMIETPEAVGNIREILSVPGIDVLLIGPSDLSINYDTPNGAYKCIS